MPRYHKFTVNGKKLEESLYVAKEFTQSTISNSPKRGKAEIEKIEVVKHLSNTGKLKIIVNGNYRSPLEVRLGINWSKFYDLAERKTTLNKKDFLDYFNSQLGNPLYAKLRYKKTQILKSDGAASIVPNIPIEVITENQFTQRKNKAA